MPSDQFNKVKNLAVSKAKEFDASIIGKYIPRNIIPPVYFVIALILMGALAYYAPVSHLIFVPIRVLGGILFLIGLGISASSAASFKKSGTPIKPFEKPVKLVTDDLYRFSRNPMYLGMIIMLIGFWIALGTMSPVIVIPVFFIIIQEGFIKYEEGFLEKIFGNEYRDYESKVRRWI